jgi:hypothetical protein
LPENWKCINTHGSPNTANNVALSINKEHINSLFIYPNPVQNILYIAGIQHNFNLQVYTITGQKVFRDKNTNQVNISQLKKGVYLIKIIENQKSTLLKFIKY